MSVVCIIPSRYESSRFPGKPLADLCGKPMVRHVYDRVLASPVVASAAVATDDERIYRAVVGFGGTAVMTAPRHRSGTDRVAEAASLLGLGNRVSLLTSRGTQPLFRRGKGRKFRQPFLEDSSKKWGLANRGFCRHFYLVQV